LKLFSSTEEISEFFGRNLSAREEGLFEHFLATGEKPLVGGCWHCTESVIRTLCGWVELYEKMVKRGEASDWRESGATSAEFGLPYGPDWS